jgi:tetratricopeptide (TPR) repeat protein
MLEQAVAAGDLDAARSAAQQLWTAGDHRFDAQLVLLVDAMRRSDWKAARVFLAGRADKAGMNPVARLIVPTFQAWIDVGARARRPDRHLMAAAGTRAEPPLMLQIVLVHAATRRGNDAARLADEIGLSDRLSQLVARRAAATLDRAGEGAAAERLRARIVLAAGEREDPMLLLPDQPVTSPRAGSAQWLGLLADSLARTPTGDAKLPLLFARAAHWLNDEDWAVRATLVEALIRDGQEGAAMALLDGLRGKLPPVLAMRQAELIADSGNLADGLERAAAAARDDAPRALLVRLADLARRSGDARAASAAYERLDAALGEEDRALRSSLLLARAELKLQADEWDAASPLIERAVALQPDDPVVLNFAGYSALERRKDVQRSIARIEAAWAKAPQNASITDSLGWAYFLTGRTDEAVELLEKAQRGEPDNAVIVEHLGDAYWQAGRKFLARYSWRAAALLADAEMATRIEAKLRDGLTPATVAP